MDTSGVGVLDKAAIVLGALEAGPSTLAQLVAAEADSYDDFIWSVINREEG